VGGRKCSRATAGAEVYGPAQKEVREKDLQCVYNTHMPGEDMAVY
jgi:hypothetical protein